MKINIETERLILRTLTPDDVLPDYVAWLNDPSVNKYLACANMRHTFESCLAYVMSYDGRDDKDLIGIFLRDNGLHIGNLTLSSIDWKSGTGVIGVCIGRKECMGKGFGKEALGAVVNYCFSQMRLRRLEAHMTTKNIISLKLFKACGFEIETEVETSTVVDGETQHDYIVSLTEEKNPTTR